MEGRGCETGWKKEDDAGADGTKTIFTHQ